MPGGRPASTVPAHGREQTPSPRPSLRTGRARGQHSGHTRGLWSSATWGVGGGPRRRAPPNGVGGTNSPEASGDRWVRQSQDRPGPGTGGCGRPALAESWLPTRLLETAGRGLHVEGCALLHWCRTQAAAGRRACQPRFTVGAGIRAVAPPPAAHAALSSLRLRGPERQRARSKSCKAAEPPLPDGLCPGWAPPAPQCPWAARPREGRVRLQRGQGKPGGTRVF